MAEFIERIVVNNRQAFGQIVMEWSRGERAIPTTLAEAEAQLGGVIEFPLPSYIIGLQIIPSQKEVWTIKLPPADMLDDRAARIADPNEPPYDVPNEYRIHTGGNESNMDQSALFEFRVGDYTCSLCG